MAIFYTGIRCYICDFEMRQECLARDSIANNLRMLTGYRRTLVKVDENEAKQATSIPLQKTSRFKELLFAKRWHLVYVGCLGCIILAAAQTNLNVAIVCMVNSTNTSEPSDSSELKFNWSKSDQALVLSAYFYGYVLSTTISGWLAEHFGAKRVAFIGMLIGAICSLVIPVCARVSIYLVVASRVVMGLGQGVMTPCLMSILGRWSPPLECTRLSAVSMSGTRIGKIAAFPLTGLLCHYGFDNGWGSVFYITGMTTVLWCLLWYSATADSPSEHGTISEEELCYITSLTQNSVTVSAPVPWKSLMLSPATWACVLAEVCYTWITYTIIVEMPTFLSDVWYISNQQTGLLSALPYISQSLAGIMAGELADFLRSGRYLSTLLVRRIFQSAAFLGSGLCLVCIEFVTDRYVVVFLLVASMWFIGLSSAGHLASPLDFAPRYAGQIYGVKGGIGALSGIICPVVAGVLTTHGILDEWRLLFCICASFSLLGTVIYCVLVKGEAEPWAVESQMKKIES